ncbi:MAG TPA: AAA family ATPase [Spirochaetota bacterium]|nr:AAA family ATPase [Spirochaetota bacterium]
MKLKNLPIGQSSFENLIKGDMLYVDKTEIIYRMITNAQFYFLSRPRRFGKSLLISTLEEIFKGNKELFKDLWIYKADYNWEEYPVVIIDFNHVLSDNHIMLQEGITKLLVDVANAHGLQLEENVYKYAFVELIKKLSEKYSKQVVLLIDEYDKPIITHLGKGDEGIRLAEKNRDILKNFYGTIKAASVIENLRFVLLTGVSKFSKAGVFSELNNLSDITMHDRYASILGITEEELAHYFDEYIKLQCNYLEIDEEEVRLKIREYYNGYRFSETDLKVYNPFSLIKFFDESKFRNYWFESGTPTFLVNLIKERDYYLPQTESFTVRSSIFSTYELPDLDITALLFQTGYLTVKDYDSESDLYTLSYPNLEVKNSFVDILFKHLAGEKPLEIYTKIYYHLSKGELEEFISVMTSIFAGITYDEGSRINEANFHTLFYVTLAAGGLPARSQVLNYSGRIDMVVEVKNKVYIFEFKCNQSAEKAIEQIKQKRYCESFRSTAKEIYLVGINFDMEKRNIAQYKWEIVA